MNSTGSLDDVQDSAGIRAAKIPSDSLAIAAFLDHIANLVVIDR